MGQMRLVAVLPGDLELQAHDYHIRAVERTGHELETFVHLGVFTTSGRARGGQAQGVACAGTTVGKGPSVLALRQCLLW